MTEYQPGNLVHHITSYISGLAMQVQCLLTGYRNGNQHCPVDLWKDLTRRYFTSLYKYQVKEMDLTVFFVLQRYCTVLVVNTYRKSKQETGLANTRISNQQQLEQIVTANTQYKALSIMKTEVCLPRGCTGSIQIQKGI